MELEKHYNIKLPPLFPPELPIVSFPKPPTKHTPRLMGPFRRKKQGKKLAHIIMQLEVKIGLYIVHTSISSAFFAKSAISVCSIISMPGTIYLICCGFIEDPKPFCAQRR
jgi:hypothetical protein